MSNWSTSTPVGSDLLSQGDDVIRLAKQAIQEALRAGEVAGDDIEGVEAIFPGASPSTAPVYRYRGLKGTTAERPTAGQYGFYYDTTRNVLQRDNGTSWDDIGQNVIPSGTKMLFYQASAPVGWTAVAVNDKFLRVVTAGGTGGSTGGTNSPSSTVDLSHTHTTPNHQHTLAHTVEPGTYTPLENVFSAAGAGSNLQLDVAAGATTVWVIQNVTENSGGGTTGTGLASALQAYAYADVIVASKDA